MTWEWFDKAIERVRKHFKEVTILLSWYIIYASNNKIDNLRKENGELHKQIQQEEHQQATIWRDLAGSWKEAAFFTQYLRDKGTVPPMSDDSLSHGTESRY